MAHDETTTMSLDRYTADAKALVAGAQALADERSHAEVQPVHLLSRGLETVDGVSEVLRRAGTDVVELRSAVERAIARVSKAEEPAYLSATFLDLLERASREADRDRARRIGVEHLLNALSQEIRGPAGEILGAFGIGPGALRPHMGALRSATRDGGSVSGAGSSLARYTRNLVEEARSGAMDPVIGRDHEVRRLLTILERRRKSHPLLVGEPGVGKGAVVRALSRRIAGGDVPTSLAGACLYELDAGALVAGAKLRGEIEQRVRKLISSIGASYAGRDAVLVTRGIDQLFGHGPSGSAVGELLKPALSRGEIRLLGTTTPEGARRIQDRDAAALRCFTTLAIEEPSVDAATEMLRGLAHRYEEHHGVRIGEGAIVAAVSLAKRYLQDRFLPDSAVDLLDEAAAAKRVEIDGQPAEFDEAMRRLDSLQLQIRSLRGNDDAESVRARTRLERAAEELEPRVRELRARLEARRGAVAAVRAIRSELEDARSRLVRAKGANETGHAGELELVTIPELEARLTKAEQASRNVGASGPGVLDQSDVADTLALWTGIPVAKMLEGEADKLLKMEERLGQRVVGQDDAVRAISRAVRRGRVGLRDPKKPIGSFLFLGPSGVGKTELAKALAEFLFDDEAALTRLDMSEFMERHMAQRLLGAPPGYADSERGGFLTEAIRKRPYSVLLFDEVEKAHEDVFNLLLQVLDDGRLTDGRGRLADFTNTVVIMTSNIGSTRILDTESKLFETQDGRDALRDVLLEQLREFFRPEFLNRIDDVVVFRPLDREHLAAIVDIQLRELGRLLADRQVTLHVDRAVKDHLVELGYEPALGARPLKRAILKHLQDPLAETILAGGYAAGADLHVVMSGDAFVFET